MEYKECETNNETEIIIIDDTEEIIDTKENLKKLKSKKHHKRKVKLGKNHNNNEETLYITQKQNVKKTKFHCVINVNSVPKKKKRCQNSIIRFARNECRSEAYYNRIVPICMRQNCFSGDFSGIKRCRTVDNREYRLKKTELKVAIKRSGILSPVSSITVPDSVNISYEDVSDKSFSSEDELDTLIKRTKQREHQFTFPIKAYSAPLSSTPIPMSEVASTYSGGSLHSTSTLVLPPLETETYSPATSPGYSYNVSVPYSPAMAFDCTQFGNIDFPIETPYSPSDPTNTPFDCIQFGNIDFPMANPYSPSDPINSLIINEDENQKNRKTGNGVSGVRAGQYSPVTREHENENHESLINNKQNVPEINGTNHVKIENIKLEELSENEDFINNAQIFQREVNENNNILFKTEKIKRENENAFDINENFEVFVKVEP